MACFRVIVGGITVILRGRTAAIRKKTASLKTRPGHQARAFQQIKTTFNQAAGL